MKIAYCLKSTFNSGGMERIVTRKINALANKGYDITLITTDQKQRPSFFKIIDKVKIIDLAINYDDIEPLPFFKKLYHRQLKIKKHHKILEQLCVKEQFDIIISTYGNEINFIHKIRGVKKKIAEIHFSRGFKTLFNQSSFRKLVNRYLIYSYECKASKLDAFVCLTQEDLKDWKKIKNIRTIPNFIESRSIRPSKLTDKKVVALGRLSYQKGYDMMLKVWQIVNSVHPDWILHIYGGGELEKKIKEQRDILNLTDAVKIHQPVSDTNSLLEESSIYCMTSRFEGMPMVLLEAMACGLPIVSFDCKCGPKDLLSTGESGILVPFGDIEAMASSICKLIENDTLRKSIGHNAYIESENYMMHNILPKWEKLFIELLSK